MYEFVSERRKGLLLSLGNSCNTHLVATKWCLLSEMTWWIIIRNVGSRLGGCKCLGFAQGLIKKTSNMAHWLTHIRSPRNHPLIYSWCWVNAQTDIFMMQCAVHISWSLISLRFMKDTCVKTRYGDFCQFKIWLEFCHSLKFYLCCYCLIQYHVILDHAMLTVHSMLFQI